MKSKTMKKFGITAVLLFIVAAITAVFIIFTVSNANKAQAAKILSGAHFTEYISPDDFIPEESETAVEISAKNAIVWSYKRTRPLYEKTENGGKIYPASTTKLLTVYTALQYLSPDEVITVGEEVGFIHPLSSKANLKKGQQLTVAATVKGLLLPSGNDAAYVLAAAAGRKIAGDPEMSARKAVAAFVDEMNDFAKQLGLENTHFTCPDGIHDDNHYTSIYDMVKITKLVLENETVAEAVKTFKTTYKSITGEINEWKNTNKLLDPSSDYYCAEAIGVKTGYTESAGNCLVAAFEKDGEKYIIAVYGCPTASSRFRDVLKLYNAYCK